MVLPLVFVNREVDTVGVDVIVPGLYIVKEIIINNLGQFYFQLALLQKDCHYCINIIFEILNINTCNNALVKVNFIYV